MYNKATLGGTPIFLILYTDDILHSAQHTRHLAELRRQLGLKFAMKGINPDEDNMESVCRTLAIGSV